MDFSVSNPIKKEEQGFSFVFWIIIGIILIAIVILAVFLFINNGKKSNNNISNFDLNKSNNSSQYVRINKTTTSNSTSLKKENKTEIKINNSNILISNNLTSNYTNDSVVYVKINYTELRNAHKLNVSLNDVIKSNSSDTNISQVINTTNASSNNEELNLFYQVYYSSSIMSGVYNQYSNSEDSLLDSLITYQIENLENFSITLNFVSEIQGYSLTSVDKIKIPSKSNYTLNQNPALNSGLDLREITSANLHYKIEIGSEILQEETIPIKLYAKDTMVWGYDYEGDYIDTSYWIAAWVTPHATEIDELIRRAAKYHLENSISGYLCSDCRSDDDWNVYTTAQIKAIYQALKNDYKITYINAPISYASNNEFSQRVKLPKDSIRYSSANCIEGSVLFASALESIGMNPYIELVPGHAFLCYDLDPDGRQYSCLETTMIGSYSFEDALDEGIYEANAYLNDPSTQLISIADERNYGVMPIS